MSREIGPRFKTIPKFQKDNFKDDNLEQVQFNTEQFVGTLSLIPIIRGRLITDIQLQAIDTNRIEHKLNRSPRGYMVIDANAPYQIYTWDKDSSFLVLSSSTIVKISLWVF